jgi:hypothetical protein
MPFAHYLIWVYCDDAGWWYNGYSKESADKEYRQVYDLTQFLLKTYNGSGKAFYLGHWEGDWHLRPKYDPKSDIPAEAIAGMAAWLNTRQKAIDDAKRDTPHRGVAVFGYTEVNLVKIGMDGRACLTNDVLPKTSVDYVSYSSYDTQNDPRGLLLKALNHIESKLAAKAGLPPGKRVFLGEYGFPAQQHGAQAQDEKSRQVMKAALEWGCPFVLYWEMYNNEVEGDRHRGFWLIDDKGDKQPVYLTHQRYYTRARKYVAEFEQEHGRLPARDEFGKAAVSFLGESAP